MLFENPVAQQSVCNVSVCTWSGFYAANLPCSSLQQRLKSSMEMVGTAHMFKVKNRASSELKINLKFS